MKVTKWLSSSIPRYMPKSILNIYPLKNLCTVASGVPLPAWQCEELYSPAPQRKKKKKKLVKIIYKKALKFSRNGPKSIQQMEKHLFKKIY